MSLQKRVVDFFIFSNLFIALAAVAFTMESQIQIGLLPKIHPYLFLIFFATLFEYNSHKLVTILVNKECLNEPKFEWIRRNLKLFYGIAFVSVAGFLVATLYAKWSVLITLLPLGVITLFYSFPVYIKGRRLFRLREFPFIKIFIISFVWSATCIVLPVIQSGVKVDTIQLLLFIIERFLFVFAITVPFDIRDMQSDKQNKLKTLPLLVGEKRASQSANAAMVLFVIMCALHYSNGQQVHLLLAFVISGISTLIALNNNWIKRQVHYHYGVLDGTMLLQGLLVLLFYFLMPA